LRRIALLTAAIAAAACSPAREDVEVDWTFAGQTCAVAGVATIYMDIAGERLNPDHYTCAEAPVGVGLGTFLVGDYQLTISGYDRSGALAYQTTQVLQVRHGQSAFAVDVEPVGGTGQVTLHWSFDGRSCAQAGIATVHASVDNQVLTDANDNADLPCSQQGIDGATIDPLVAGLHTFDLVGVDASGQARYALYGFSVTAAAGQNVDASPNLSRAAPTDASANLTWAFAGQSCAQAGVDHVQIFFDPNPDGTGGTDSGTVPCSTNGVDGAAVDGVPEGYHSFAIVGTRSGRIAYFTHHPPQTLFRAGLISDLFVPAEAP
jgi:hypothetical protein